jgi:hypothetical protein
MNSMRVVVQGERDAFYSMPITLYVGTTILAAKLSESRLKIIGVIDNSAIPFYDFDAKLLVWRRDSHGPTLDSFGGAVKYGHNDFAINSRYDYEWNSAKIIYLGPDDRRFVRTSLFGF